MVIIVSSSPRPQAWSMSLRHHFLLCGSCAHSGSLGIQIPSGTYPAQPILETTTWPLSENQKPKEMKEWEGGRSHSLVSLTQVQSKKEAATWEWEGSCLPREAPLNPPDKSPHFFGKEYVCLTMFFLQWNSTVIKMVLKMAIWQWEKGSCHSHQTIW